MATPHVHLTSEAEEMYLITIAMAVEDGHEGPVPLPYLGKEMDVSRVSANEMVKKLVEKGYATYAPYKGVSLTKEGARIADDVLRHRRLWALFLSEHLGLSPSAADTVACEFEHITPSEVAQRLSHFLGDPLVGPGGKRIPAFGGQSTPEVQGTPLASAPVGRDLVVVEVGGDTPTRSFLADSGLTKGTVLRLMAVGDDHGCLVRGPRGNVHLVHSVAEAVFVNASPGGPRPSRG